MIFSGFVFVLLFFSCVQTSQEPLHTPKNSGHLLQPESDDMVSPRRRPVLRKVSAVDLQASVSKGYYRQVSGVSDQDCRALDPLGWAYEVPGKKSQ
jgi:hypothetical protein